jgi:hypothetical protein
MIELDDRIYVAGTASISSGAADEHAAKGARGWGAESPTAGNVLYSDLK